MRKLKYRWHSKECMWRQRGHLYMVFNVYNSKVTRRGTCHPLLNMKSLCLMVGKL